VIHWQPGYVYPPVFYPPHQPLGPLHALFFLGIAIAVGVLTFRRPALGIGALILCIPFAEARYIAGTSVTIPKAAFVGFLIALILTRPKVAILAERPVRILIAAFCAVLAAIALSLFHATHAGAVAREFGKWLEYAVLFAAVAVAFANDPDDRPIWRSLIGIAIFESIYAGVQLLVGAPSGVTVRAHILPRVAGSLEGPNQFAGWLNLIIPILFARMLIHRDAWLITATTLVSIATVLTLSRSGIVAGLIGLVLVIIVTRPPKRVGLRFVTTGALICAIFVGVGLMVGVEARFFSLAEVSQPDHLGTRSILWSSAIKLWKMSPLTGIGAGNYELDLGMVGYPDVHTHANSIYLQFLAENGVLGLIAILFLVCTSIATFARSYSRRALVVGVFAASIAIALHQIFDYLWFFPKVGAFWCLLLAIGVVELIASREDAGALPEV
jgi:O-antigen ligase